jgi:hypothetical protein
MVKAEGNTLPNVLSGRQMIPLVVVGLVGALGVVAFHPMIGLPIAGAALASLVYGGRSPVALVAGLFGAVLAGALAGATIYVVVFPLVGVPATARAQYIFTALVAGSLMLVGPFTAVILRRRSPFETIVVLTAALTALQTGTLALFAKGAGQGLGEYVANAAKGLAEQARMGEEFGAAITAMWPSALVVMNGFTALFVVIGVGIAGVRFGVLPRRMTSLAALDLDPRAVLLPIAALAMLAAGRLPGEVASTFGNVGNNLLVVARWVFFVQGIAVFAGLYERARFARPVRLFGFVLLGVTEAFIPAVSLTGLADIWLNVRRLPRDASASGTPGATQDAN